MVFAEVAPVMIAIPLVIVFEASAGSVPKSGVEHRSVVARSYPMGAFIRRTGPVTIVPAVVASIGIPIAVYPKVAGSRGNRANAHDARRRGRPDTNSKR